MKFSELVRLLEQNGFRLIREKGSIRYYVKTAHPRLIRVDFPWRERSPDGHVPCDTESCRFKTEMITLPYSLVIEATDDPDFFGFQSTDLEGFTGIGHSIEDCLYKARWGMADHSQMMRDQCLPVATPNPNPRIVIQNERKLQPA